jgi:RsiW-degrading membrane proteinase PrsW (M82 family)
MPAGRPPAYAAKSTKAEEFAGLHQAMAAANKSALRPLRWVFLLAIIPLAMHVFFVKKATLDPAKVQAAFNEKLNARLADKPDLRARLEQLGDAPSLGLLSAWADAFDEVKMKNLIAEIQPEFDALSEADRREAVDVLKSKFMEKYCGLQPPPLLSKKSWGHWGLAGLAALLFLSYFCFAYPRGNAKVGQLLGIGVFTGTIGILLLLLVQFLSALATGFRVLGHGILMLIWVILVALAYSYSAAENPENGFILSFIGFTLGVGLLEELCKQLPLIWHFRRGGELDWRGACVWGLASGAGFGVSEGIMYSARYYNGSATLEMYLVRFISCVAMHAAWAGSAAILLYRRQGDLQGEIEKSDWIKVLAPVLIGPMILHGIYDTLLKREMDPWALLAGAASFVFFVWLQEREARDETGRSLQLMGLAR